MAYTDYRFKFTNLATALNAFAALRAAGVLGTGDIPENMLGDHRDTAGVYTGDLASVSWIGRQGSAATSYTDPDSGLTVTAPARGDPAYWYVHIRSTVPPSEIPFDPSTYGLVVADPAESAAVLGVWA